MSDLIDRQAAIDALEKVAELYPWKVPGNRNSYSQYNEAWQDALGRAEGVIGNLPSAQPERIRGRWIEKPHVHGVAYCSLCDYELHTNDTNFCPNCGADMRGEK